MLKPMPSPRGTNLEGLHMPSARRGAAYDAAILDDDKANALREYLTGKLTDEQVAEAMAIVTGSAPAGAPEAEQASDAARLRAPRYDTRNFPHSGRLKLG